jgi:hypothetical protein
MVVGFLWSLLLVQGYFWHLTRVRTSGWQCVAAGPTLTELLERLDLYQVCFVLTEA